MTYILNENTIIPLLGRFYSMKMSDDESHATFTAVEVPEVAPPDGTKMALPIITPREEAPQTFGHVERLDRVTAVLHDTWKVLCWGTDTAEDGALTAEFTLLATQWNANIRQADELAERKTYRVGDVVPFDMHVGYRLHRIQPGNSDGLTGWVEFDPELILLRSGEKMTY